MTGMKYQTSDMEKHVEGYKGTHDDRETTLTLEYSDHLSLHPYLRLWILLLLGIWAPLRKEVTLEP